MYLNKLREEKKKPITALLVVLFLFFQFLMPPIKAYAETTWSLNVTNVFLTDTNGVVVGKDGGEIDIENGIKIGYVFDVPSDVQGGDKANLKLPEIFKLDKPLDNIQIKRSNGSVIANVVVDTDRNVTITFTEDAINAKEATLEFTSTFDQDKIGDSKSENIRFEVNDQIITIPVNFKEKEKIDPKVTKEGQYIGGENDSIKWTITVEPNQNLKGVTLKDTLGDYQTYEDNSFKVNENEETPKVEGNTISYTFPDEISKKQVITLITNIKPGAPIVTIDDGTQVRRLTNSAELKIDDSKYTPTKPEYVPKDNAIVNVATKYLVKYGYVDDNERDKIQWKVFITADNCDLNNVKYIDQVQNGTSLITENADESTAIKCDKEDAVLEESSSEGFAYSFDKISNGETVKIEYATKITDKERYMINNDRYASYSNIGILDMGNDNKITVKPVVTFQPEIIKKEAINYDYSTREVTWQIVVNKWGLIIENPEIIEDIPEGQEYIEGSFEISKKDSEFTKVNPNTYDKESGKLTYNFNEYKDTSNNITDCYTIKLKTKVTDGKCISSNNSELRNIAYISGNGAQCEATATQPVKNGVLNKCGYYDEIEDAINWDIEFNKNAINIANVVIEDKLPEGIILADDNVFKVYKAVVNSKGEVSKGEEITEGFNCTYENNVVTLTMPEINECYILSFKTKVNGISPSTPNIVSIKGNGFDKQEAQSDNISSIIAGGGGTGIDRDKGKVVITKVDSSDNSKKIAGAKFKLYNQNKKLISKINEVVTNQDGVAEFDNLNLSTKYYVQESEAPDGYSLDSTFYEVNIDNSKVFNLTVDNTKKTTHSTSSSSKHHNNSSSSDDDDDDNNDDIGKKDKPNLSDVIIVPSKIDNESDNVNKGNTPIANNTELNNNSSNSETKIVPSTSADKNIYSTKDSTKKSKVKKLPQSGSMIDQKTLIFTGILLIFAGLAYGYKKRMVLSNIKEK